MIESRQASSGSRTAAGHQDTTGHPGMVQDCPAYLIAWADKADAAAGRLRASGWRGALHLIPAQRLESHVQGCCAAHRMAVAAGMAAGQYPFLFSKRMSIQPGGAARWCCPGLARRLPAAGPFPVQLECRGQYLGDAPGIGASGRRMGAANEYAQLRSDGSLPSGDGPGLP